MDRAGRWLRFGLVALSVATPSAARSDPGTAGFPSPRHREASIEAPRHEETARLRLPFPGIEPNRGQADPSVGFVARVPDITAFLSPAEAALVVGAPRGPGGRRALHPNAVHPPAAPDAVVLRIRFPGASAEAAGEAAEELPGRSNYFLGSDPLRWATDVPRYARLRFRGIWPGVDLQYEARSDGLEYRFTVAPGADPSAIALALEGGETPAIDGEGALLVGTPGGTLRHSPPVVWQERGGRRSAVPGRFVLRAQAAVGFEVGAYDRGLPLVIDPTLSYGTFLGGSGEETTSLSMRHASIAVDSSGAMVVAGITTSTNYPLQSPIQPAKAGGTTDAFLTKISPSGTTLVFSTYMGGNGLDECYGVVLDGSGDVYVAGRTTSTNMPVLNAYQGSAGGGTWDGFAAKLGSTGSTLSYATYLGSSGDDACYRVAVDGGGAAYLTGQTTSTGFPRVGALQNAFGGGGADAFVTKLAASGSSLAYSTFLGGLGGADKGTSILVDSSGNAFVSGITDSIDFPTASPIQGSYAGGNGNVPNDAFACRINAAGTALAWSTYLGGSGFDDCTSLALDSSGAVYLCGFTSSANFPTRGPFQSAHGGGPDDAYLARIAPAGTSLSYSTYFGGNGYDEALGLAVTADGSVHLGGITSSTNSFPASNALQGGNGGGFGDAFFAMFHPNGGSVFHSTFYGGSGNEWCYDVAVDGSGSPHFTGITSSTGFRLQGPFQSTHGGGTYDGFVVRLSMAPPAAPSGLAATAVADRRVSLSWTDGGTTETGFEVERMSGSLSFQVVGSTAANLVSFQDTQVLPQTAYTYRVKARNSDGLSTASNESSATTPATPLPPAAPTGVQAAAASETEIDVSWTDASDDEQQFSLLRRLGNQVPAVVKVLPAETTTTRDSGLLPGRTYAYRVKAVNAAGSTTSASEAAATTDSIVVLTTGKSSLTATGTPDKDKCKVSGTLAGGPFDPAADGLEIALGDEDDPLVFEIAPGEEGWKAKDGKYSWKSPKGDLPKAKVAVDTVKGTFSVSLSGGTFPEVPASPVWIWLRVGSDAGARTDPWTEKKPGSLKFP